MSIRLGFVAAVVMLLNCAAWKRYTALKNRLISSELSAIGCELSRRVLGHAGSVCALRAVLCTSTTVRLFAEWLIYALQRRVFVILGLT